MITVKQYSPANEELEGERAEFTSQEEALAFIVEEKARDENKRDYSVAYYTITVPVEKRVRFEMRAVIDYGD